MSILFPQVMLPLHIFEPRYRRMVRDAETQRPPLIGMTLLRGNWQEQYEGTPDIFPDRMCRRNGPCQSIA